MAGVTLSRSHRGDTYNIHHRTTAETHFILAGAKKLNVVGIRFVFFLLLLTALVWDTGGISDSL